MPCKFFLMLAILFSTPALDAMEASPEAALPQAPKESIEKSFILSWLPHATPPVVATSSDISGNPAAPATGLTEIPDWLQDAHALLKHYSDRLNDRPIDTQTAAEWQSKLKTAGIESQENMQSISNRLEEVGTQLLALGDSIDEESPDVTKKRKLLHHEESILIASEKYCQLTIIRIHDLEARLQAIGVSNFHDKMLVRHPPLWHLLPPLLENPRRLAEAFRSAFKASLQHMALRFIQPIGFTLLLGLLLGIWLQQQIPRPAEPTDGTESSRPYMTSLALYFRRRAPILMALLAVGCMGVLRAQTQGPILLHMVLAILVYVVTLTFLKALLCASTVSSIIRGWTPKQAQTLYKLTRATGILFFGGYALYWLKIHHYLSADHQQLLSSIILILLSLNMILNLAWLRHLHLHRSTRVITNLTLLALFATLVLEVIGFHPLAFLILKITLGIFIGGTVSLLLRTLFSRLYDQLDQGEQLWQAAIRKRLGLEKKQSIPGLIWLRALTVLAIWSGLLLLLVWLSGYSTSLYPDIRSVFRTGFSVGNFTLVPLHLVWAVCIFSAVLILSHLLQQSLSEHWLKKTNWDHGAREAIVKIIGYVGTVLAFIIALSAIGIGFTNLAVIAGALSVGIGFGLQNIVNNFISGIILLFERPIRRGDWIVAGTTEGFVKSINIRSTIIQTFDRADVIVPNAELISAPVTNWVLSNRIGRLCIPIGVAYGSDTQKVKATLQRVAESHDNVLNDASRKLTPSVLFMGFGDSALQFELRCFLQDVKVRLSTQSDLNFAIDAAFREAHIEIPFPQHDVHIRSQVTPETQNG